MKVETRNPPTCPSCRNPMEVFRLATHTGVDTEVDICFACQGLWFDPKESQRLAPAAVVELFERLHDHRDDQHLPVSASLTCSICKRGLQQGFDLVRTGRYITYRCPQRHGRFATFSSFMIEKGFVRMMTKPEIEDLARRVDSIACSNCGAPVDIRREHACPYCQAAFSLLDPQAVQKALQQHRQAAPGTGPATVVDLADALMTIERDRQRTLREEQRERMSSPRVDLWSAGIELVWRVLR